MVDEPAVHVGHPLDREPASGERPRELGQPGVVVGLQRDGLGLDADVVGRAAAQRPADAGKAEHDGTGHVADLLPATGVVAEEHDGRRPGQPGQPGARRPELVTANGDEDHVGGGARRIGKHAHVGMGGAPGPGHRAHRARPGLSRRSAADG
jgi:hypothetical protein